MKTSSQVPLPCPSRAGGSFSHEKSSAKSSALAMKSQVGGQRVLPGRPRPVSSHSSCSTWAGGHSVAGYSLTTFRAGGGIPVSPPFQPGQSVSRLCQLGQSVSPRQFLPFQPLQRPSDRLTHFGVIRTPRARATHNAPCGAIDGGPHCRPLLGPRGAL